MLLPAPAALLGGQDALPLFRAAGDADAPAGGGAGARGWAALWRDGARLRGRARHCGIHQGALHGMLRLVPLLELPGLWSDRSGEPEGGHLEL